MIFHQLRDDDMNSIFVYIRTNEERIEYDDEDEDEDGDAGGGDELEPGED